MSEMPHEVHACQKCGMPGAVMHYPGGYLCPVDCTNSVEEVLKVLNDGRSGREIRSVRTRPSELDRLRSENARLLIERDEAREKQNQASELLNEVVPSPDSMRGRDYGGWIIKRNKWFVGGLNPSRIGDLEERFRYAQQEIARLTGEVELVRKVAAHDLEMLKSEISARRSLLDSLIKERDDHKTCLGVVKVALLILRNKVLFKEGADALEDALRQINELNQEK